VPNTNYTNFSCHTLHLTSITIRFSSVPSLVEGKINSKPTLSPWCGVWTLWFNNFFTMLIFWELGAGSGEQGVGSREQGFVVICILAGNEV
jgi:hypothetical protein